MDRASAAKNRHTWINCTVSAKRQGSGTSIGEKTQLWDDEAHIYTNLFANGTFYRRISPTSFYSMMAEVMVAEWLTNSTRFCINENFPTGSPSHCYWGLPSISADDSTYDAQGYWRGYIWGPMAQLTYVLEPAEYDHLESVSKGSAQGALRADDCDVSEHVEQARPRMRELLALRGCGRVCG